MQGREQLYESSGGVDGVGDPEQWKGLMGIIYNM